MTNEERKRRLRFMGELNSLRQRYALTLVAEGGNLRVYERQPGTEYALSPSGDYFVAVFTGPDAPSPSEASRRTPDEPSRSG